MSIQFEFSHQFIKRLYKECRTYTWLTKKVEMHIELKIESSLRIFSICQEFKGVWRKKPKKTINKDQNINWMNYMYNLILSKRFDWGFFYRIGAGKCSSIFASFFSFKQIHKKKFEPHTSIYFLFGIVNQIWNLTASTKRN